MEKPVSDAILSIMEHAVTPAAKAFARQVRPFISPVLENRRKLILLKGVIARKNLIDQQGYSEAANGELYRSHLGFRAGARIASEEMRHQANLEAVANQAFDSISAAGQPVGEIDLDWMEAFFDLARKANSDHARAIWAKVLGTEALKPGSISARSLDALRLFSREDGETLQWLASRTVVVSGVPHFVCTIEHGPNLVSASHQLRAEAIGLVLGGASTPQLVVEHDEWRELVELLDGRKIMIRKIGDGGSSARCGGAGLTAVGRELVKVPAVEASQEMIDCLEEEHRRIGHFTKVFGRDQA